MHAVIGLLVLLFALLTVLRILASAGRGTARVADRGLTRIGRWLDARAARRERREVKRREQVGALQAETVKTLTEIVADQRAEIADLRARLATHSTPAPQEPGQAGAWYRQCLSG